MSKSHKGSKTTKSHIKSDSPKFIERSDGGRRKFGSTSDGTQAAHKFGFGLANVIETNTSGRPMSEESKQKFVVEMNSDSNLRIKSEYGNKIIDERRDARIATAYVEEKPIEGKSTAERAYQAYQGASNLSNPKYAEEIGNMRVKNEETGGYYKVKNHQKQ